MKFSANLPSKADFIKEYHIFKNYLDTDKGKLLFKTIVNEYSVLKAIYVTDELGMPGVTAVAEPCVKAVKSLGEDGLTHFDKQFAGALMCFLLDANGYDKKKNEQGEDFKKAVPHKAFSSGQVYIPKPNHNKPVPQDISEG